MYLICLVLFVNSCLPAQKYEPVTVKAGTSIKDYFPLAERYLNPNFTAGKGYKIDFESPEDLLKLAGFMNDLIFKNPQKS